MLVDLHSETSWQFVERIYYWLPEFSRSQNVICVYLPVLGYMARNSFVFVALIYRLFDVSFSQNGCSITNICDSTQHDCLKTENVALGKRAEISSLLMSSKFGNSAPACVVVNGNRSNSFSGGGNADNCAHTNETDYTGWWQLHLGRNYTIQDISIYSQNSEGDRLSEVRITIDGQVCHDFPSTYTGDAIINIKCDTPLTGSTVRFEKRQRAAGDNYYLALCEVEIWVCRPGLYGPSCSDMCNCKNNDTCNNYYGTCPNGCVNGYYSANCSLKCGHCLDVTCHIYNGQCMSECQNGWTGPYCMESCPDYSYGFNCSNQCGHCLRNGTCNTTTGECHQGCDPGWTSVFCNQTCPVGSYGLNCNTTCGSCESTNVPCDPVNGHCPNGCKAGYQSPICDKNCTNNTYGKDCGQTCGHCASFPCDTVTGHCDQCQGNFTPPLCDKCRNGWYGESCSQMCVNCAGNQSCHRGTGLCDAGCLAGWESPNCSTPCTNNTYGKNCSHTCGRCASFPCDTVTGHCDLCRGNFTPPLCDECQNGWYGESCSKMCVNCAGNQSCHRVTGLCDAGCLAGWESTNCSTRSKENSKEDTSTAIIVGVVVPFIVILIVVVVVIFILRRRRQPAKKTPHRITSSELRTSGTGDNKIIGNEGSRFTQKESLDTKSNTDKSKPKVAVKPLVVKTTSRPDIDKSASFYENIGLATSVSLSSDQTEKEQADDQEADLEIYDDRLQLDDADNLYRNDTVVYGSLKKTTSDLDSTQQFLVDRLASGEILIEFKELPKGLPLPHHTALTPINKRKNRFTSVVPYEHNRVVLSDGYTNNDSTDYVNASYIRGCQSDKQYIAAQGPRDNTVTDFWRMVWQEHVTQIVMLTSLMENGKSKCYKYWPAKDTTQTYGPLTVTGLDVQFRAFYFIRSFKLTLPGSPGDLEVIQYHFLGWPDHGVPTIDSLVDFWRYVRARTVRDTSSPLLVHCSAGVGRTGTFIGLDIAMERIERKHELNILDIVLQMRSDKTLMVQAPEQYVFLHKSILEAHTGRNRAVSVERMDVIFPRPITALSDNQRIDKEFQTLKQMQSLVTKQCYDIALQEKNKRKNRNPDVLPDNDHLVYLTELTSNDNQYINAVYMPTFRERRGCILTQLPLSHTLIDFWRLVDGCDVTTIVSLGSTDDPSRIKDFCQYWPVSETKSVHVEPYTVTLKTSSNLGEHVTSYTVNLEKKGTGKPRDIRVLRYTAWTDTVPSNTPELLLLMDKLDTSNCINGKNPVIIQCLDGGSKSALFCVLRDVISRITYDREVDVYMTVRKVQNIRPGAVTSEVQYRYCYQVAQQKMKELNVYGNI